MIYFNENNRRGTDNSGQRPAAHCPLLVPSFQDKIPQQNCPRILAGQTSVKIDLPVRGVALQHRTAEIDPEFAGKYHPPASTNLSHAHTRPDPAQRNNAAPKKSKSAKPPFHPGPRSHCHEWTFADGAPPEPSHLSTHPGGKKNQARTMHLSMPSVQRENTGVSRQHVGVAAPLGLPSPSVCPDEELPSVRRAE